MRKFLTALIVIPLGLILVTFAVANRHFVTVSFDPFMAADPALSITLPLFLLLILVAAVGRRRWRLRGLVRPAALAARRAPA